MTSSFAALQFSSSVALHTTIDKALNTHSPSASPAEEERLAASDLLHGRIGGHCLTEPIQVVYIILQETVGMAGRDPSAPRGQGPVLVAIADVKGWVDEAVMRGGGAWLCLWQQQPVLRGACKQTTGHWWFLAGKGTCSWPRGVWDVIACLSQHPSPYGQPPGSSRVCTLIAHVCRLHASCRCISQRVDRSGLWQHQPSFVASPGRTGAVVVAKGKEGPGRHAAWPAAVS